MRGTPNDRQYRAPIPLRERMTVDGADLGRLLGITRHQVTRLYKAQKLPQPHVWSHKAALWCVEEVRDWLAAGCPVPAIAPHWVWKPSVPVNLHALISTLQAQLAVCEAAMAAGDNVVSVRQDR